MEHLLGCTIDALHQHALTTHRAGFRRLPFRPYDFHAVIFLELHQELGRLVLSGVDHDRTLRTGEGHLEQAALFAELESLRLGHGQLENGIVLDLAGKPEGVLHHVEQCHEVGLQTLGPVDG